MPLLSYLPACVTKIIVNGSIYSNCSYNPEILHDSFLTFYFLQVELEIIMEWAFRKLKKVITFLKDLKITSILHLNFPVMRYIATYIATKIGCCKMEKMKERWSNIYPCSQPHCMFIAIYFIRMGLAQVHPNNLCILDYNAFTVY